MSSLNNKAMQASDWLQLGDLEFLYMLALGRGRHGWELELNESIEVARLKIANSAEFISRNPLLPEMAEGGTDLLLEPNRQFIERAYKLVINEFPSENDLSRWTGMSPLNPIELCCELFHRVESIKINSVELFSSISITEYRQINQYKINVINQDLYNSYVLSRSGNDQRSTDKISKLNKKELRVAVNAFKIDDSGCNFITKQLSRIIKDKHFRIYPVDVHMIINEPSLRDADILITNNNDIYNETQKQYDQFSQSTYVTACWLWDNHHQFGLSLDIAKAFDFVFPAHSNGQTYLHGGKAIIGSVQPCAVFQWSPEEAEDFFYKSINIERNNSLYGRFNAYSGRCSLRDKFLEKISEQLTNNKVTVISSSENDWAYQSKENRFSEMMRYKAIICNPIYNDIPARLFDALVVGAIPLVPHGLPDLQRSFSAEMCRYLPIITYLPDNLKSLTAAVDQAVEIFDNEGRRGALKRHEIAIASNFVHHRIASIIAELVDLAAKSK